MNPKLKLDFCGFWDGFDKRDNFFYNLLAKHYEIEITDKPDYLIYSRYSEEHALYRDCIKIFFTGDNVRPNFRHCDYSFSFDHESYGGRNYRLPVFVLFDGYYDLLTKQKDPAEILKGKTKFCNFVYSNTDEERFEGVALRNAFFDKLSKYKQVDSPGKARNNMPYVSDKRAFIKQYKFTIAFENSYRPGYTTEKLMEPMLIGSMPIYRGNERVAEDFNTDCFLNWHDYGSDEALIERIMEVDRNDDLYLEMMARPSLPGNRLPDYAKEENILAFFENIFTTKIRPVSRPGFINRLKKRLL
jgi:hypothetical protein